MYFVFTTNGKLRLHYEKIPLFQASGRVVVNADGSPASSADILRVFFQAVKQIQQRSYSFFVGVTFFAHFLFCSFLTISYLFILFHLSTMIFALPLRLLPPSSSIFSHGRFFIHSFCSPRFGEPSLSYLRLLSRNFW